MPQLPPVFRDFRDKAKKWKDKKQKKQSHFRLSFERDQPEQVSNESRNQLDPENLVRASGLLCQRSSLVLRSLFLKFYFTSLFSKLFIPNSDYLLVLGLFILNFVISRSLKISNSSIFRFLSFMKSINLVSSKKIVFLKLH